MLLHAWYLRLSSSFILFLLYRFELVLCFHATVFLPSDKYFLFHVHHVQYGIWYMMYHTCTFSHPLTSLAFALCSFPTLLLPATASRSRLKTTLQTCTNIFPPLPHNTTSVRLLLRFAPFSHVSCRSSNAWSPCSLLFQPRLSSSCPSMLAIIIIYLQHCTFLVVSTSTVCASSSAPVRSHLLIQPTVL
jgi:hypothetical protein